MIQLLITPLLFAAAIALLPRSRGWLAKSLAVVGAVLNLVFAVWLATQVQPGLPGYSVELRYDWIPSLGSSFHLGVDGISIWFLLLNALMGVIAVGSTGLATARLKEFLVFLLLLEAGIAGVFMALDLVVFYVFWEAMLIPAYFLVGVWGRGRPGAAFKFVLFTLTGSLLMLVAIVALYFSAGAHSFDLNQLGPSHAASSLQFLLFAAFGLAFAIKAAVWPFHSWLPDTYEATPAPALALIAGVMGKAGIYGFIRFGLGLFPSPRVSMGALSLDLNQVLPLLAAIGIVYGALGAIAQTDIKRLVAFSSISHMGFITLGVFAFNRPGLQGSILQSVNHGLIVAALFLLVEAIARRRGTTTLGRLGMMSRSPALVAVFTVTALAALGLPGLNGFVGEFLIMLGAWQLWPGLAAMAGLGVVLAAVYMLRFFQRATQGEIEGSASLAEPAGGMRRDLTAAEFWPLAPLVVLMLVLGFYAVPITGMSQGAADLVLLHHQAATQGPGSEPGAMDAGAGR